VENALGKSAIVLLHDGLELKNDPNQENTVTALREIIRDFKADGYDFVTVPQLIEMPEISEEYPALFNVIKKPKTIRKP
jgi:peptidoglycan/xylan/chitin deacetylase (PgdA/CDA1 family)